MFEPSRHIFSFSIAGMKYWDGALALGSLKVGDSLELRPEPDNPHDPNAVAIYAGDVKMGYVPADQAALFSVLAFYGHSDIFEARVLKVSPEEATFDQVYVGIFVVDVRK